MVDWIGKFFNTPSKNFGLVSPSDLLNVHSLNTNTRPSEPIHTGPIPKSRHAIAH